MGRLYEILNLIAFPLENERPNSKVSHSLSPSLIPPHLSLSHPFSLILSHSLYLSHSLSLYVNIIRTKHLDLIVPPSSAVTNYNVTHTRLTTSVDLSSYVPLSRSGDISLLPAIIFFGTVFSLCPQFLFIFYIFKKFFT